MTYSIEFQMLSKDAASKITTQVSKTSVMSFQFKNIVLKINHTESKMQEKFISCGNRATGRSSSHEKK